MSEPYEYGLWQLVLFHIGIFLFFGLSFLRPRKRREWRSMGAFAAFVVALYTEMYGFPLTIYLLTTWLGRFPVAAPFAHASGNLWASLALGGWGAGLFMTLGGLVILLGMLLMGQGWQVIHQAQGSLVTSGVYGKIRHPQYVGIGLVILGALIQWPTLLTLLMAPVLLASYGRLARREGRELEARFGEEYRNYRERVPMFIPRWLPDHWRREIPAPVGAGDPRRPDMGS
ncbi:MAG: methyltransferase family protein [Candidatus Entotheonellia bacterium]